MNRRQLTVQLHQLTAYVSRKAVSTIYGRALTARDAAAYLRLQGVRADAVDAGLKPTRHDGTVTTVAPVFTNAEGGQWLYVVDELDMALDE